MSARGRALKVGREVVRIFRQAGWSVTPEVTRSVDNVSATARNSPAGYVGAVGGDGYLAAVAEGLAEDPERILVPFPGGRGNDLCRALGIGTDASAHARTLLESDLSERQHDIDGIWVGEPRRLALGVVSMGVDAAANERANRSRLRIGPLAYAWSAVSAFARFHPLPFVVEIDGSTQELPGWVCSLSNSGWIGGGVNIVPSSDIADGKLELLNVGPTAKLKVLPLLAKVLGGRNLDSPLVRLADAYSVTVLEPSGLAAMADGDMIARVPFTATVANKVVRVVF